MSTKWTADETSVLAEMWLCGSSSPEIAQVLGRTRHAVMGRVNKTGLMKRQQTGLMQPCDEATSRAGVDAQIGGPIAGCSHRHRVERVVMAMVADGRQSHRLASIAGVSQKLVDAVSTELSVSHLWPANDGPPQEWWQEGQIRVDADLIRLAKAVAYEDASNAA